MTTWQTRGQGAPTQEYIREHFLYEQSSAFDVRYYGVKADASGTEDFGPAIQRAVDAAEANSGGVVSLPPYRIPIHTPITISRNGITLRGASAIESMLWVKGDFPGAVINVESSAATVGLEGFQIWQNKEEQPFACEGIVATDQVNLQVRDLRVHGTRGAGLRLRGTWDGQLENVDITGCGDASTSTPAVVLEAPASGRRVDTTRFYNLKVEQSPYIGLHLTGSRNNTFVACKFHGVPADGAVAPLTVLETDAMMNLFSACHWQRQRGGSASLRMGNGATDNLLAGCSVANNSDGIGILFDGTADNNTVVGTRFGAESPIDGSRANATDLSDSSSGTQWLVGNTYMTDISHPIGFYGATPVAQQTGVAVTAAGVHAALVALGLITA